MMTEKVLILDYGSGFAQVVARKIRELNVYCEILPYSSKIQSIDNYKAVVLASVLDSEANERTSASDIKSIVGRVPVLVYGDTGEHLPEGSMIYHAESYPSASDEESIAYLENFILETAAFSADWTAAKFIEQSIEEIRSEVGDSYVIMAISGGVDSSVAATIIHKAIGKQLFCVFVDNGVLRKNEYEDVLKIYKDVGLNVRGIPASDRFYDRLKGLTDPEKKRKAIGNLFIEIFEEEAGTIPGVKWLGQGTIYPDIIESVSSDGKVSVKSHHNVGGLPERMHFKLLEPLKTLFKEDVRRIGRELGLPNDMIDRHPFPGPGLAVRILGEVTPERVKILQEADHIYTSILRKSGYYEKIWQAGTILLPVKSVGVSGNKRTYENAVALRAVNSVDGMTAQWINIPYDILTEISTEIINKVNGVNRVVYDISNKPPATIEWE